MSSLYQVSRLNALKMATRPQAPLPPVLSRRCMGHMCWRLVPSAPHFGKVIWPEFVQGEQHTCCLAADFNGNLSKARTKRHHRR